MLSLNHVYFVIRSLTPSLSCHVQSPVGGRAANGYMEVEVPEGHGGYPSGGLDDDDDS